MAKIWSKFYPLYILRYLLADTLSCSLVVKVAMQKFTQKIVEMMKSEGLFQSQGGPIILSQVRRTTEYV